MGREAAARLHPTPRGRGGSVTAAGSGGVSGGLARGAGAGVNLTGRGEEEEQPGGGGRRASPPPAHAGASQWPPSRKFRSLTDPCGSHGGGGWRAQVFWSQKLSVPAVQWQRRSSPRRPDLSGSVGRRERPRPSSCYFARRRCFGFLERWDTSDLGGHPYFSTTEV